MQKNLFLDYLDGSKKLTEKMLASGTMLTLSAFFRHVDKIKYQKVPGGDFKIDSGEDFRKTVTEYLFKEFPENAQTALDGFFKKRPGKTLQTDTICFGYVNTDPDKKNYVFSSPLTKALMETKVDHDTTIFNDHRLFYFEMPGVKFDGEELLCAYGWTARSERGLILTIYHVMYKDGEYYIPDITFNILEDVSLSQEFGRVLAQKGISYDEPSLYRTLLNAVIYIYNNSEEMNEALNEFSKKKSKVETEKKIYTEKPFVELGKDFIYLRLTQEGDVDVRGHYRWQWCGEGRTQMRLTFVRPHTKTIKKNI